MQNLTLKQAYNLNNGFSSWAKMSVKINVKDAEFIKVLELDGKQIC